MGNWANIFGWRTLFRWDTLACIVPGLFLAVGLGMLTVDWFPYHLLISQISFALAFLLSLVKTISVAIQSRNRTLASVMFGIFLCVVLAGAALFIETAIQRHKKELITSTPVTQPHAITQTATDTNCSNIAGGRDVSVNCSSSETNHEKSKKRNKDD